MKTIILAGGRGTRLWPLSRELLPKQFIRILDNRSLFQKTVERARIFSSPEDIFIVTNREYKFRILDDLSEIGDIPKENILLEPDAKNTLPAIYWAVKVIGDNCKVAVLPSDHIMDSGDGYIESFKKAMKLADSYLITFGIKPTKPHTGYGYIKPGRNLGQGYEVAEFKEKPDLETAMQYVEKGYFWNSGMFMFRTDIFLDEVQKLAPEVAEAFEKDIEEAYRTVPEISIDYGIMEKTNRSAVVPLDTYWNDLGSFDAIYDALDKDENGNAIRKEDGGDLLAMDSSNNLFIVSRLTSAIGVEDLLVIDTDDALLIAKKGESQKVKEIYSMLKGRGDERIKVHRTAYRPWGSYTVLETGEGFKIKRITVLPSKRLSLQRHYHRSEHWVVVSGIARVVVDGKEILLRQGESTFIKAGAVHRLENPGKIPLEVIEVQIGQYLGEDDIERFEDDFGR
ncbi:mannose-1-phosphate guanylyltransferase/mannose-6-phosphate isomerase [Archaeoglobus sulfaticallidus]|uniref:mannose-1-phosphate guanylyltransferase/mannose-6-phosphate isomerase n=1 Tax=Archaeoglobus sulfaticallidus TaxID=1316941 RepID=UPI00064E8670